ncbi:MAG: hypothetical protein HOV81_12495 [Kofleriaceae bacterium]|nr:hypothetical protein [Kofleriaceae bacterium]
MRSALIAATLVAATTVARADNELRPDQIPTKARELAERGRAAHDAGDYDAAVSAFKEAYVLAPTPGLLFNIAQAYRLGGKCDESAWMYRRFLDTNPSGDRREIAQTNLALVEKCGHGGLRVGIDTPKIVAKVPVPDEKRPDAPVMTDDDRSASFKRAGIGMGVAGGVALVGAAVFAFDAHQQSNTVAKTYAKGGKWADVKDADERGRRAQTFATVLGIGGGLALASGAILYAVGHHYEKAQHVSVTPTGRGGAQVTMSWRF